VLPLLLFGKTIGAEYFPPEIEKGLRAENIWRCRFAIRPYKRMQKLLPLLPFQSVES
jgi:hypothetical protein